MQSRSLPRRVAALLVALTLAALALATPASASSATSRRTPSGAVTVPAPGAGDGATVTVSKTSGLVNQTVEVSWTGFTPSSAIKLQNGGDSLDVNTLDPVRVYECRGADPASSSDCYGSPGYRGLDGTDTTAAIPAVSPFTYPGQTDPYDATPDGPANWQDTVTHPDGTGGVTIQVFTKRESAGLGCDVSAPCSIVVVPNYGRPQGATEDLMDAPWAWARRTVVPLAFQRVDDACSLTGSSLRVEGSPMAGGLLAAWRGKTCVLDKNAVNLDYTAIGEPQTREDVATGVTDLGLTMNPLTAKDAKDAGVVYAPVSITGLVVAFQIDDANGQPVTSMKLDPRLVAKLITASYRSGADPAVLDNPVNIFHDPEFLKLNPGVAWPSGSPGNHPLLLGDPSDGTAALTRWLWSNPEARAFLKGKPDPWGMTVNSNYKNLTPFDNYPLLDQNLTSSFSPISGLDNLSRQLSIAQFPGAVVTQEDGINVTSKPARQNPGAREVIGIIDAADAAKFLLPTASLENTGGAFVRPTAASMTAGMAHATVGSDGVTRTVDLASKDKGIYPLSVLVSAALSTKADKTTRGQMADFLDYVEGQGQVPGDEVGKLPSGHAPLTAALRAQVRTARNAVLAGPAADPTQAPSDGPSEAPSSEPSGGTQPGVTQPGTSPDGIPATEPLAAPTDGAEPASAPSDGSTASADTAPQMMDVSSQSAGRRLMTLPGLLVLALIGLLVGPLLLWLERTGRGPQWLRR